LSGANSGNGNATHGTTEKLNFQATEHASLLTTALPRGFLGSAHLFIKMGLKVDEAANFVFVQLNEQEQRHPHYARQDKINLIWGRIFHETKESGSMLRSFETI
jgi:hypothetical protein